MRTRTRHWSTFIATAFLAATCIIGVFALSGCGSDNKQVISEGLRSDIASIKSGNSTVEEAYFGTDISSTFSTVGISNQDFASAFFKNLSITINTVTISGDAAVVDATITTTDYDTALSLYDERFLEYTAQYGTDESTSTTAAADLAQIFLSTMNDSSVSTLSNEVTLEYTLQDGTWLLTNPLDFDVAVLGQRLTGTTTPTTDTSSTSNSTSDSVCPVSGSTAATDSTTTDTTNSD
jgi:hypothetical protein